MVLDSEKLGKNAVTLLKNYSNAKEILQKAKGDQNYIEIAKELEISPKITSPVLKLAKDLGFANKIKPGVYKKITSNMKYIPNRKKPMKRNKTIDGVVRRFSKHKDKKLELGGRNIRFDYESKVEKMTLAYRWLFITENMLRDLIRGVIGTSEDWWEKRIPEGVKSDVKKTIQKSKYDDVKRKDDLEYAHLGQLKEIILWKKNWKDFESSLRNKDRSNFDHELTKVISPRNAIGHCIPLSGDDYKYVEMRFQAILKLLR